MLLVIVSFHRAQTLTTFPLISVAHKDLIKSGMRQAFIMAEGGLEAIGSEPDGNSNAKWMFPEQETRDLAARIFGTGFDAQVQYGTSVYTRRKYTVIRGSNSRQTICINYSLKKNHRYIRLDCRSIQE